MPTFFYPYLILLMLATKLNAQQTQRAYVTIQGTIVDGLSLENLSGVHIYTARLNGATSDIDGHFYLKIDPLDSIHFSRVGYETFTTVLTSSDLDEQQIYSMKKSTTILESVKIDAYYQANTIIKRYKPQPMKVLGVKYSENGWKEDYHLGASGAIFSPITAIYRLVSKEYKEEKKHYEYLQVKQKEDKAFAKANRLLDEALEITRLRLDNYYYRDFILFLGISIDAIAQYTVYDLVQLLPEMIGKYKTYLQAKE